MPWCIPLLSVSYTYQQGLITAIDRIQKECIAKYGKEVPEYIINEVIETGELFMEIGMAHNVHTIFTKLLALTSCYYSVAFVLVHRVP